MLYCSLGSGKPVLRNERPGSSRHGWPETEDSALRSAAGHAGLGVGHCRNCQCCDQGQDNDRDDLHQTFINSSFCFSSGEGFVFEVLDEIVSV